MRRRSRRAFTLGASVHSHLPSGAFETVPGYPLPDRWGTQSQRGAAIEAARAEGNLSRANWCATVRRLRPVE
jgi:hypothetical protein